MNFLCIVFTLVLIFVQRISSLPLACSYNGSSYGEGETVRTEEPCLSCVCQRGALECSLRVCADHPATPPPGCFFLHKPDHCCPQLFCEEERFTPVAIELRKGFQLENKTGGNDCIINGSIYAEGSAVASSQPCEYCYCVEGETKCLRPRCLRSFEGCKAIYEKSSCCPTNYDCRNADTNILKTQIENLVSASVVAEDSEDSSRTLSEGGSEREIPKEISSESTSSENLSEEGGTPKAETEPTTTEASNAEETTVAEEKEATTPPAGELITPIGFQTTKMEYFEKEPTTVDFTEESTLAEQTVTDELPSAVEEENKNPWNVTGKLNFSGSPTSSDGGNSSLQDVEDSYDAYDYDEPRLPPSLPNLVIFPFVAADAVIKDEAVEVLDVPDQIEIKRMDVHPVFFKDYFSPPVKTEGGFLPKEPLQLDESFYERSQFRKDKIEQAATHLLTDKEQSKVTSEGNSGSDLKKVTPTPLEEIRGLPKTQSHFAFEDAFQVNKSFQTKRPVTVTYKNVVVDFYPNYLVTTTRAHPQVQSVENPIIAEEAFDRPFLTLAPSNEATETFPDFQEGTHSSYPPKKTRDTPPNESATSVKGTTTESSFFDFDFFKSFFPDKSLATTTTTTATSIKIKHKYSSKIKGQVDVSSTKPLRESIQVDEKGTSQADFLSDALIEADSSSTTSASELKISNVRKQIKNEGAKGLTKSPFGKWGATAGPGEANLRPPASENLRRESVEQSWGGGDSAKAEAGALLKLAGCNIYGMMYRVGKVIAELSGPCLECLCTDLGVQCRPLKC